MDNRGFASGEGKQGFTYQNMNGNYPGVYYSGQEMMVPYGQYGGGGGATEMPFNEQCVIPQQVGPVPGNIQYNFGAHQYMQYRQQQAHIMQAAYNSAQHQGRVGANPQQIADSIYNMAAHAYSYQQQTPPLPPTMANPYSPGTNGHTLSVRTGPSPANSLHSPAGSSHSMGERPLLSPHVQSTASMYNYHQSNLQSSNRHSQHNGPTPAPPPSNMAYYGNGTINGCMTSDLDHRQSVERLAAISHLPEQYNTQKLSPAATGSNGIVSSHSQAYQHGNGCISTNMAAPLSCEHSMATVAAPVSNKRQSKTSTSKNCSAKSQSKQSNVEAAPSKAQSSNAIAEVTLPPSEDRVITDVPKKDQSIPNPMKETNLKDKDSVDEDDESKRKETAADSGIDSEQVDKDNDEEHDTSTTSNKSEGSPPPVKPSPDILNDDIDNGSTGPAPLPDDKAPTHNSDKMQSSPKTDACNKNRSESNINSPENKHKHVVEAAGASQPNSLSSASDDLNDSFISNSSVDNNGNSLSNSCSSKQSMGDESRLPPRKRKQQLSEHTESLTVPVPLKKRGRPSKEAIRLREAAKSALAAEAAVEKEYQLSLPEPALVKERKQSSKEKLKKPVHSGSLLHSPKFNPGLKITYEENNFCTDSADRKDDELPASHEKKSTALDEKSNAVLVSPPKKPKASVSEMQKALMRVVSSDAGEVCFSGKRKRGRPLGSKNKKTKLLDHRVRSNSTSSTCKSQVDPADTAPPADAVSAAAGSSSAPNSTLAPASSQSHNLTSSVHNRVKSLHIKKSKNSTPKQSASGTELKLPVSSDPWVCVFCNQISNYKDMGDLFGGYSVQANVPLPAKLISHRKTSDLRQQLHLDPPTGPANEIWFHEKCIIWAPGVYMVAGKLYGIYEALTAAFQTTCSLCKKKGAILGCFCKGCTYRYHIHCALSAECLLNEENFSMLCTKHKDKKIVLM